MQNNNKLLTASQAIKPWLVDVRRDFHRHPEFGMEEHRTQAKIIEYLKEMNIPYEKVANTGIVGLIKGNQTGKTVALRADMDALPIQEINKVDYKSSTPGKMHACGHDAHMTILLGAAKILIERKEQLNGNVKLLFQPAEETVGGAEPMIAEGVLENPKVDVAFGLHMAPDIQVGKIGIKYDQMYASSDAIELTIKGNEGHAAYPHSGTDAIVIAAHVITAIQTIVSRNIDPRKSAVISLGTINGGTQANVIANEVKILGTIRTLDSEVRAFVLNRIEEILVLITQSFGGGFHFYTESGYIALNNNNDLVDIVKYSAKQLLGEKNINTIEVPSMGVEDFSYFAEAVPSAFFLLGSKNEEKDIMHNLHTNQFDIDEDSLPIGVALQVQNVFNILSPTK